jgi:hypothetical protein
MPRFDIYRNPNPRASHAHYLDVQSDLVTTATRWCIPWFAAGPSHALVGRAQVLLAVLGDSCVVDTPNILAVPTALLRNPVTRVGSRDQLAVEAAIEFMLRGY